MLKPGQSWQAWMVGQTGFIPSFFDKHLLRPCAVPSTTLSTGQTEVHCFQEACTMVTRDLMAQMLLWTLRWASLAAPLRTPPGVLSANGSPLGPSAEGNRLAKVTPPSWREAILGHQCQVQRPSSLASFQMAPEGNPGGRAPCANTHNCPLTNRLTMGAILPGRST